ncbi:hypothetical protein EVJ58_g9560 [Rhodofomes roseus]|uniref:Alpha/beta hydrolase fold-3 domain-containing protein n=1 Tax=Rhodofomes roseus TaxID=34475 RepID=A0A4Y9XSX0_9APHY|nr:hypothetical protein EVJ58_g9560 [Rhodofomes roseus]
MSGPCMRAGIAPFFVVGFPYEQEAEDVVPAPEDEAKGFVSLSPVEDRFVVGEVKEIAELNGVEPRRTYGYWYKAANVLGRGDHPAKDDEVVYLQFHGGGYSMETPQPSGYAAPSVCSGLFRHAPRTSRVLAPAYPYVASLPFPPKNPFPAALLDALAAYHYFLHTAGFRAEKVVLSGDSAGGHLAIALVHYLATGKLPELPASGALLLVSPTSSGR